MLRMRQLQEQGRAWTRLLRKVQTRVSFNFQLYIIHYTSPFSTDFSHYLSLKAWKAVKKNAQICILGIFRGMIIMII